MHLMTALEEYLEEFCCGLFNKLMAGAGQDYINKVAAETLKRELHTKHVTSILGPLIRESVQQLVQIELDKQAPNVLKYHAPDVLEDMLPAALTHVSVPSDWAIIKVSHGKPNYSPDGVELCYDTLNGVLYVYNDGEWRRPAGPNGGIKISWVK